MLNGAYNALPHLPEPLEGLAFLAMDLRFTWSHTADELWRRLDTDLFALTRNPWLVLLSASQERLEELANDGEYCSLIEGLLEREEKSLGTQRWYQKHFSNSLLNQIAYFSMEFGLSESLPIYSGGLGLLAGDHLKAAHDLGVPLTGVGLLYQSGYFRQALDVDGSQIALYPSNNVSELPVIPVRDKSGKRLRLELNLPGHSLIVRVWLARIGLIRLYLLDTNDPGNHPVDRCITSELYGDGNELRLMQEILLGIGGWRVLQALGIDPKVCHLNEGHAALAVLERARHYMKQNKVDFDTALTITRAGNLFTSHTPVEAGFDRFAPGLIRQYLQGYADCSMNGSDNCLNISIDRLLALGRRHPHDQNEPFNMAYLAIRGSSAVNGVSELHGAVSRKIFAPLFPDWPLSEVPVGHVTNGVHVPSWDSAGADALWTKACGKERWMGDLKNMKEQIRQVPDETVWEMRRQNRHELVKFVRKHHVHQQRRHGIALEEAEKQGRHIFDPNVLTLGFARRFATYKRPTLLLQDPERFARILTNPHRPVQLVVSGKAHPADKSGKAMVRQWFQFMQRPDVRPCLIFIPDYNILIAEKLVQGVDVWINNPRRPWEASGTSGMKVLVNGGLNLSELDGWWAEAFDPSLGWSTGDGKEHDSNPQWDAHEAEQLYDLLENEIVPTFYDSNDRGIPPAWVAKVKESMARLTPHYSTNRMVREYVEKYYFPLAENYTNRDNNDRTTGKNLQHWRDNLADFWDTMHIGDLRIEKIDDHYIIRVPLILGEVLAEEVKVQVFAEPEADEDSPVRVTMNKEEELVGTENGFVYSALVPNHRALDHYTVRIVPYNEHAAIPLEAGQIMWKNA